MPAISVWSPPPGMSDHSGRPLPGNICFFSSPPPEIGDIRSAFSEMPSDFQDADTSKKLRTGFLYGLYCAILMLLLDRFLTHWGPQVLTFAVPIMFVLGGIAGIIQASGNFECQYVGEQGVSMVKYEKSPKALQPDQTRLLFADAMELRTTITQHYTNGIYQNTSFDFTWNNGAGEKLYSLHGTFTHKQGNPPPEDNYHFALAAEAAWTDYLRQQTQEDRQFGNPIRFNLTNNNYLLVSPKQLELVFKGQKTICSASEIDAIEVKKGVVSVRQKDARPGILGIGSSGIFKFDYADLANAKFCLMLMNEWYRVEENEESNEA